MDWPAIVLLVAAATVFLGMAWLQQRPPAVREAGPGSAEPARSDDGQPRWDRAGLVAVLLFGLAYGYGLGVFVDGPLNDPCQGSPGMAAFGLLVLGIAAGLVILPVVSILYAWRAPRLWGMNGAEGCFVATILTVSAAVVGYFLFGALPLFRWVPSCQ